MPPFRQARLAGPSTRAGTMSTFTLGHVQVRRSGYGAMQLADPYAFGPPRWARPRSVTVSRWALPPAQAFSLYPELSSCRSSMIRTAGHCELGQHPVDHGLAVELGRRGQGFGAAGRGPDRAQQRELEELRAALARPYGHEGDPVILAWLARPRVQQ